MRCARSTRSFIARVTKKTASGVVKGVKAIGRGARKTIAWTGGTIVWAVAGILSIAIAVVGFILFGAWVLVGVLAAAILVALAFLVKALRVWVLSFFYWLANPSGMSYRDHRAMTEIDDEERKSSWESAVDKVVNQFDEWVQTHEDDDFGVTEWTTEHDERYAPVFYDFTDFDPIIVENDPVLPEDEPHVTTLCAVCGYGIGMDLDGDWYHLDQAVIEDGHLATVEADPLASFDRCSVCEGPVWRLNGEWGHVIPSEENNGHVAVPQALMDAAVTTLPLEEVPAEEADPIDEVANPVLKAMARWMKKHKDVTPSEFQFKNPNWTFEEQHDALRQLHRTAPGVAEKSYWMGRLEALTRFHKDERTLDQSTQGWALVFTRYRNGGDKVNMQAMRDGYFDMVTDLKFQAGHPTSVAS